MLAIRLGRIGKGSQPNFRIIIQEKTRSPKNKALETLGNYNPKTKTFNVDKARIEHWVKMGAHPSSSLAVLFKKNGFTNMDKYVKIEKHQRKKKEEAKASAESKSVAEKMNPEPAKETKAPKEEASALAEKSTKLEQTDPAQPASPVAAEEPKKN